MLGVRFQFRTDAPTPDGPVMRFHGALRRPYLDYEWLVEFIADEAPHPCGPAVVALGYGEPNLYTVTAQLCHDGQVLDERRAHRLAQTRRRPHRGRWRRGGARSRSRCCPHRQTGGPQQPLCLHVNDQPIMIKGPTGCPWTPSTADAGRVGGPSPL